MILGLKEILYKLKFEFFYVQTNSKLKNRDEERVVPIPHPEVILCPNGLLLYSAMLRLFLFSEDHIPEHKSCSCTNTTNNH